MIALNKITWKRQEESANGSCCGLQTVTSLQATKQERIHKYQEFSPKYEDEVTVEIMVGGDRCWATIDTSTISLWAYAHWFRACGGNSSNPGPLADSADGHPINAAGTVRLSFISWECSYCETVGVFNPLLSKLLIG